MWKGRGAALLLLPVATAIENGLGRTPPMGWRSWNLFGASVNQALMTSVMDSVVAKTREVDGVPTSLCDLGYCDVGLDDGWQACGTGTGGYNYHTADGKPLVNLTIFPNLADMTAHAHRLGLTAGWYANNCRCKEKKNSTPAMYEEDVHYLTDLFHFDAVKLDGCGTEKDLDVWSQLINKTSRPVMIENCHWGHTVPNATWCPWNFYRSSGDIHGSYASVMGNLQTTVQFARQNLSKPGCWAYPDMLELGCKGGSGGDKDPGLNFVESRAHFGAWCIVSSPLTLSHDPRNDTTMDELWPIISNREAIEVNQAWAGHSGSPFKQAEERVSLQDGAPAAGGDPAPVVLPAWQFFYKPVGHGRVAVLVLNHDAAPRSLRLDFAEVPTLQCTTCAVRDVWARRDLPAATGGMDVSVASHDSLFLVLGAPRQPSLVQLFM